MTEELEAIITAAQAMLDAVNILWAANNPEDAAEAGVSALDLDSAQELCSECYSLLRREIYYGQKALERAKGAKP